MTGPKRRKRKPKVFAAWFISKRKAPGEDLSAICARLAITHGWHRGTWRNTGRRAGNSAQLLWRSGPGRIRIPRQKCNGRPMTIEHHQNSPLVVEPYHLLDICLISDGGVAFILTTAERARDLRKPPVYVLGQGFGEIIRELWWEKKNYTHMAVKTAKEQAFGEAGLELNDVKCAQLYDCFTGEVLFQLEG